MIEYEGLTKEQNEAVTKFNELAKILGLKQKYDTVDFNNALSECVDKLFIPEEQAEPEKSCADSQGIILAGIKQSCENCGNNKIKKAGYCHCDFSDTCSVISGKSKWTPKEPEKSCDNCSLFAKCCYKHDLNNACVYNNYKYWSKQ